MLHYEEAALVRDLARATSKSQVAFAAASAERLFPAYEDFSRCAGRGGSAALSQTLARVWEHLSGDEMPSEQIRAALSRCMELIPGEDDGPWVDGRAYADDAVSAIAYTLRALDSGDPQEAAWAARRAYDAADFYVTQQLGIEDEAEARAHPVIQAELARQRRDVDELVGASLDSPELFVRLRERARVEALAFFPPTS